MLDITHSSIVRDYRNFYASTFDRNIPFTIPGRYNTNARQFGKRNLGHDRYTPSSPPRLRIPQSVLTGCQYRDGELRRGRHCEANNLICADSRRKSSLRTLPRHTLSVFQQSQSRDLHVYWKAVPVARSPSRDERAPSRASPSSPSRFSTLPLSLSLVLRIDTERSLCLLSVDCSRHARFGRKNGICLAFPVLKDLLERNN